MPDKGKANYVETQPAYGVSPNGQIHRVHGLQLQSTDDLYDPTLTR